MPAFCLGLASASVVLAEAGTIADRLRAALAVDVADARGIMCTVSTERTRYLPRAAGGNAGCAELIAAEAHSARGAVEWQDRLRLTVTTGPAGEEFALSEPGPFERGDISGILRDSQARSGEFSNFLRNIVNGDADTFQTLAPQDTPAGRMDVFGFTVPAAKSHFIYTDIGGSAEAAPHASAAAYRGSLFTLPGAGDLKRLTLEAENTGNACRVQYSIDYTNTRVEDRDIVLPQSSVMEAIYKDGAELHSETFYSGYQRQPTQAVAAAAADPAPKPLPPNVRFRVRFQPPIDGETVAAGDPVVGVIRTTVKDKQSGVIVRAGDRIHGRIAAIEDYALPNKRLNLAIVFETIERGVGEHGADQGVEQPVSLVPLDDGDRAPHDQSGGPEQLGKLRPPGGGYFIFQDADIVLGPNFETEWETR